MRRMFVLVVALLAAVRVSAVVVRPGEEIAAEDGAELRVPVAQTGVVYALLYLGDGVGPGEVWGVRDGAGYLVDTSIITEAGQRLKLDITTSVRSATADTLTFTLERVFDGDAGEKDQGEEQAVRVGIGRAGG